jgi:chromosome segregation ATPase
VTALHVEMDKTLAVYSQVVKEAVLELCDQLEASTEAQVEMVLDHQIDLAGDSFATDKLRELLVQYRGKREQVRAEMKAIRLSLQKLDMTSDRLREIHAKLGQWLAAQRDELKDLRDALIGLKQEVQSE